MPFITFWLADLSSRKRDLRISMIQSAENLAAPSLAIKLQPRKLKQGFARFTTDSFFSLKATSTSSQLSSKTDKLSKTVSNCKKVLLSNGNILNVFVFVLRHQVQEVHQLHRELLGEELHSKAAH